MKPTIMSLVVLGLMGATAGYFLLRPRVKCPWAALAGAGAAVLPVAAFAPGGWLRKTEA